MRKKHSVIKKSAAEHWAFDKYYIIGGLLTHISVKIVIENIDKNENENTKQNDSTTISTH